MIERLRNALFKAGRMMRLILGIPLSRQSTAETGRRVLMVDDMVPDPLFGAGYPRAFAIAKALVGAGYAIDFYPMQAGRRDLLRMDGMFAGGIRFHPGRGAPGLRRLLRREGARFGAMFISRPAPMAAFVQVRWKSSDGRSAPGVIYDAEAVLTPREARRRTLFGPAWSQADQEAALAAELGLAREVQAVTAVGQEDARVIAATIDPAVFVLPHPVTVRKAVPDFADRRDLLFVGRLTGCADQSPNVDSMMWFATHVMPLLDQLIGDDYRIHVVGRVAADEISEMASERFVLHGVVEDLAPLYDRCRLFVAPTRYAAGIPLKVVEAMGEGIPCVVTPLLAEQLGADGAALAIGEGAQGFAEQCARLYTNAEAWRSIRDGGSAHVARHCSPDAFARILGEVFDHVARRGVRDAG